MSWVGAVAPKASPPYASPLLRELCVHLYLRWDLVVTGAL